MQNEEFSGYRRYYLIGLMIIVIALGMSTLVKGPEIDEYWTMLYANPRVAFTEAWHWWSADTGHPVGYYASMRFWANALPQSVTIGRLLNFVPLGIFILFAFSSWPLKVPSRYSQLFAVVLLSGYSIMERFATQRAFLAGMILVGMLVVGFQRSFAGRDTARPLAWLNALVLMTLALIDYPSFAAAFALFAAAGVAFFLSGRREEALWTIAGALAGIVVVCLSVWNAMGEDKIDPSYVIPTAVYAKNLAIIGGTVVLGQVMVSALAVAGGVALIRNRSSWRPLWQCSPSDQYLLCLLLAVCFTVIGFTVLNFAMHAMVKRQLIGIVPLLAGLITALALRQQLTKRHHILLIFATSLALVANIWLLSKRLNFYHWAPTLAAAQKSCSGYKIFGMSPSDIAVTPDTLNMRHRDLALAIGYADVGKTFGFTTIVRAADRRFDATCGGAIWIENMWQALPSKSPGEIAEDMGFVLTASQSAKATLQFDESSLLLQVPGETQIAPGLQ